MSNDRYHRLWAEFSHWEFDPEFARFFRDGFPEAYREYYKPCTGTGGISGYLSTHDLTTILKAWQDSHGFEFIRVCRVSPRKPHDLSVCG